MCWLKSPATKTSDDNTRADPAIPAIRSKKRLIDRHATRSDSGRDFVIALGTERPRSPT
jgi:hypothetical protein